MNSRLGTTQSNKNRLNAKILFRILIFRIPPAVALLVSVSLISISSSVGFSTPALAALRTEGALTTKLDHDNQTFHASLKEGFHFNTKAPNHLRIDGKTIQPSVIKGREAEFDHLPKSWSKGRASLYVCDDAVTFCEPRSIELSNLSDSSQKDLSKSGTQTSTPEDRETALPKSGVRLNAHGFIENDFNQALEQAEKQKRLLLVDFAARWCPGCVRLETEIFASKKFQELARNFIKLKIDVDRFENTGLAKKFNAEGIPTLIILNSKGEEIDRMSDYQPLPVLASFLSAAQADPATLTELTEQVKQSKDKQLAYRLGKKLVAANRYEESLPYLTQIQPPPPELLTAKVQAAQRRFQNKQNSENRNQVIQVLSQAIQTEPQSSRSLVWREDLIKLLEHPDGPGDQGQQAAEIARLKQEGVRLADSLLNNKKKLKEALKTDQIGEFTHYEPLLIAINRADLIESSKSPTSEIEQAWKKAAATGRSLKISLKDTGPSMRYLIVLTKAGLFAEADHLAKALLRKDPENPELHRRRLKTLVGLKNYSEAIKLGQECLKSSYGRNELMVAEVLAKAYLAEHQNTKVKDLIDHYLSRKDIDWSTSEDLRKSFEELRKRAVAA